MDLVLVFSPKPIFKEIRLQGEFIYFLMVGLGLEFSDEN